MKKLLALAAALALAFQPVCIFAGQPTPLSMQIDRTANGGAGPFPVCANKTSSVGLGRCDAIGTMDVNGNFTPYIAGQPIGPSAAAGGAADANTVGGQPLSSIIGNLQQFSSYGPGGKPGIDATSTIFGGNGRAGMINDTTSPTVVLPPGEFDISTCPASKLYTASGLSLSGAGMGKTIIKYVGSAPCTNPLFAWAGKSNIRVSDLTIDMNGASAPSTNGYVLEVAGGNNFAMDRVEIKGLAGDHWFGIYALGFSNGRVSYSRVTYNDRTNDISGGLFISNDYYGSVNIGTITTAGLMTLTSQSGGQGVVPGLVITGHGVPRGETVVSQVTPLAAGEAMGGIGRYNLSVVPSSAVPSEQLWASGNYGWKTDHNVFTNTSLDIQAPGFVSDHDEINGWGSGGGINLDPSSQGAMITSPLIHDGPYVADANNVFDAGIEAHPDDTTISDPTIYNVGDVCIGLNGRNQRVIGGSCGKYAQAAVSNPGAAITHCAIQLNYNGSNPNNIEDSAGSSVMSSYVRGTGTPGEQFGICDAAGAATSYAKNNTVVGTLTSPYEVLAGLVVNDPLSAMTVAQLSNVLPNKGTLLGVTDLASLKASPLVGGGTLAALVSGNGTAFSVAGATSYANWTPTFSTTSPGATPPTFSPQIWRYGLSLDGTISFNAQIHITSVGTGTGPILATLPSKANSYTVVPCIDFSTGTTVYGVIPAGTASLSIGSGTLNTDYLFCSGNYETQ